MPSRTTPGRLRGVVSLICAGSLGLWSATAASAAPGSPIDVAAAQAAQRARLCATTTVPVFMDGRRLPVCAGVGPTIATTGGDKRWRGGATIERAGSFRGSP
jgi:hypothetical protein